jgi:adenine phosphoribosyltransferase
MNYKNYVKEIMNFPSEAVSFKDISPLLSDSQAYGNAITDMGELVDRLPDYWVGIDARGFLFAASLATRFGGGIVLCRKAGKLPPPTIDYSYDTEYSKDELSIHPGTGNVVIVDDVLATGGTITAANKLCSQAGYNVIDNIALIDLRYIPRNLNLNVKSLIKYE